MNTTRWSEEQLNGYSDIKGSVRCGIGFLAVEAVIITLDVTDTVDLPLWTHAPATFMGAGLLLSNLLYLRDIRRSHTE